MTVPDAHIGSIIQKHFNAYTIAFMGRKMQRSLEKYISYIEYNNHILNHKLFQLKMILSTLTYTSFCISILVTSQI